MSTESGPDRPYDAHVTICDLIEGQAARLPHKVAVVDHDRSMSYRELAGESSARAHLLAEHGVQAGDLVGIGLERSLEMVLWVLAILEAGAAYVPLDPAYPAERLRFVAEDAGLKFLLAPAGVPPWAAGLPLTWISAEGSSSLAPAEPFAACSHRATPDGYAYIIYTSGSTGTPKGVAVTHRALAHFVQMAREALQIREEDVWMLTASLSYALQVRQLMTPLSMGATIAVASEQMMRDPQLLMEHIQAQGVTLVDFVPSYWRTCNAVLAQLPAAARQALLDNRLRQIVSVGEPLPCDLPYTWRQGFGHRARVVNILGQTETTGMFTLYAVPEEVKPEDGVVPVGRAAPNTEIHLLDAAGKEVAEGESGELYINTPSLAAGYWGRPELTGQRFLPHPDDPQGDRRLYRTGDLARRRPDGNLVYEGRVDQQVKVRGKRVDLIEVEAFLRQVPGVQDAAVIMAPQPDGSCELAAYLAAPVEAALTRQAVWQRLRDFLPEHALPANLYRVDVLPYLPNGKLDRRALGAATPASLLPLAGAEEAATQCGAPSSSDSGPAVAAGGDAGEEQAVAALLALLRPLWEEVLQTGQLGLHDDFFAVGGQSLQAAILAARIGAALGRHVAVESIYLAPTMAAQAAFFAVRQDAPAGAATQTLVPLRLGGLDAPLFLIHGLGGGVVGYVDLVRLLPPGRPIYGLQAAGLEGETEPDTTIEAMAARYVAQVRAIQPAGPYLVGGYCYGGVVGFEMARQLERLGEPPQMVAIFEGFAPGWRNQRAPLFCPERVPLVARNLPHWWDEYRKLGPAALRRRVTRRLRRNADFKAVLAQDIVDDDLSLLPGYRQQLLDAHVRAIRNYRPAPYPGKVVVFRARHHTMSQALIGPLDLDLGWSRVAAGVEVHEVAGAHNNLHLAPHAASLAAALSGCLVELDSATCGAVR